MERWWTRSARAGCAALLIVWVLASVGLPTARAQVDIDTVRYNAEQWLKRTLNKPNLILVEYAYSGGSWPDSSMGCPVPEGTRVEQGTVNGYVWQFLFDNQVRYEVHSTLDGTQAVLCSAISASPDVLLATYTVIPFSILVPEAWLNFPNADQTEVLFAPQQDLTCAEPGMRVRVLGRVASGVTPDQLLDQHLADAGATDDITARQTVGSFGRTTTFEMACGDGTQQQRIAAFVQYGSAYFVEQWAAQADFAGWDGSFLDMLSAFKPGEGAIAPQDVSGAPAGDDAAEAAPDLAALPLAHVFVGDVFLGALNDIPGRSVTSIPTLDRRYLDFSPDGLQLSFVDVSNAQLRVLDANQGVSPRKVADGVDPTFPPAWRADSQEIAYVVATGTADASGAPVFEIDAVPAAGGEPRVLGQFAFSGDCPAGADPADRLYVAATGPQGIPNALVWVSESVFIVSTRCDGGLGYLNLAGSTLDPVLEDVHGGTLSPDRSLLAGRGPEGLVIVDVPSGARANLSIGASASQIAWGPGGGSLYYSTVTLADSTALDDPADQERGEDVFGFWPVEAGVYELSLVHVDMTTNDESVIWRGQGRGIGRIAPAPDGSGVLFSVIPSSLPLAEVFQAGADPLAVREAWPEPALYWLFEGQTGARLLAYAGQPVFAPVTVSLEQPAPSATDSTEAVQ